MFIRSIAVAQPEWRVDSAEIAQWSSLDRAMVEDKIGVRSRAFLRHDETATGLGAAACEKLFAAEPDLDRASVDLLILVTQNPDYKLPHGAALLQNALGLPKTTATFDIALGCSGFVYALSVARGLMAAEGFANAIVVTCDPYSKIMTRTGRDTIGLFGDAAAATWLSAERGASIGRGDYGTDGAGAGHLIVRAGGSAQPAWHLDGTPAQPPAPADAALAMNGRAIFNFMMTRVPETIDRCLQRNGLARDAIDLFVFHQASRYLLETLAERLGLPADKVPVVMEDTGNTVSSSIPFALSVLRARGRLAGSRVLVAGFGVGLSWASNVLTFPADDGPGTTA